MLGITLVVLGILTYYVAPMSFIFDNLQLFFFILNVILVLMILGLSLLALLLLPYCQWVFLNIFMLICRWDLKLKPLIVKNLQGHKGRNTKTAMMFTIALSFLIFAGSTFSLMALMINQTLQSLFAADLYATTVMSSYYLNE